MKEEGRLDEEEGREEVKYGKELEDVDMEDDSDRVVTRAWIVVDSIDSYSSSNSSSSKSNNLNNHKLSWVSLIKVNASLNEIGAVAPHRKS